MKFDHAIIAVMDLDQARDEYAAAGFTVITGGVHSSGLTHNALVVFANASYLELMAPTDPELLKNPPEPGPGNYLFMLDAGEGCAGYAFQTEDLDREVDRVRKAGLSIGDPQSGGRRRDDGLELRWRTAMFEDRTIPFLLTDETPRAHRVPGTPGNTSHDNGATGVSGLLAVVSDLDAAAARTAALLGVGPVAGSAEGVMPASMEADLREGASAAPETRTERSVTRGEARTTAIQIGEFRLRLAQVSAATEAYLQRRGEFPFAIHIKTSDPGRVGELEIRGARIILEQ